MQARKWISNSKEVMEKIPAEERATEIVIDSGQVPITKTLGISWNSRPKWTSEVQDLKVGDVVLVIQPDAPRGRRPLGRIVEVYPGRDGHTRVAKVACGVKAVVRPIHKLIPLGINC